MLATDQENQYGEELRAERLRRGLSVKKLAKLSNISRRHIATAEQGGNISIDVLKKLMRALGLAEITICAGVKASSGVSEGIAPELLLATADDVQRAAELAKNAATTLRAVTQRVGKSIEKDTPLDDDGIHADAASLIGEFSDFVKSLRDPYRLAEVGEAVSGLLRSDATKGEAARAPGARRRRRTA